VTNFRNVTFSEKRNRQTVSYSSVEYNKTHGSFSRIIKELHLPHAHSSELWGGTAVATGYPVTGVTALFMPAEDLAFLYGQI